MSKAIETLHTCPACGQGGFTPGGLKAHQGNKTCQKRALTSTPLGKAEEMKPELLKEFSAARKHVENIREAGRRASHESILLGCELNWLKLELGERRGGNRKGKDQSTQTANFDRWDDLVEAQTGLSYDTCNRCMLLASAAKKHVPLLTSQDVLNTPFSALPEARQAEVIKTLEKAADGQSMSQLMHAFGAWKNKKKNNPPKPTPESIKKRTANAADETLSAATLMATAKEQTNALQDAHIGGAWKSLDTADLADLETKLLAYHADVKAELEERRKVKLKK